MSHLFSKKSSTSYYSINCWFHGQPASNRNQDRFVVGGTLGWLPISQPHPGTALGLIPSWSAGGTATPSTADMTRRRITLHLDSVSWLRRRRGRATQPGAAGPLELRAASPDSQQAETQSCSCKELPVPREQDPPAEEPAQPGLLSFWSIQTRSYTCVVFKLLSLWWFVM